MKKILIILLITSSFGSIAQMKKSEKIDDLLIETKALKSTEQILDGIISKGISNIKNPPENLKKQIHEKIKYDKYLEKVEQAYSSTYTESEIDELIKIYKSGDLDLYKVKSESVAQKLYLIGTEFGRESVGIIQNELKKYQ